MSHTDTGREPWQKKLAKYRRLGVKELVRFDPQELEEPLEVWDERGGALVPRRLTDPRSTECGVLGLVWVVMDDPPETAPPRSEIASSRSETVPPRS